MPRARAPTRPLPPTPPASDTDDDRHHHPQHVKSASSSSVSAPIPSIPSSKLKNVLGNDGALVDEPEVIGGDEGGESGYLDDNEVTRGMNVAVT